MAGYGGIIITGGGTSFGTPGTQGRVFVYRRVWLLLPDSRRGVVTISYFPGTTAGVIEPATALSPLSVAIPSTAERSMLASVSVVPHTFAS